TCCDRMHPLTALLDPLRQSSGGAIGPAKTPAVELIGRGSRIADEPFDQYAVLEELEGPHCRIGGIADGLKVGTDHRAARLTDEGVGKPVGLTRDVHTPLVRIPVTVDVAAQTATELDDFIPGFRGPGLKTGLT